jgi:hypothetical protein
VINLEWELITKWKGELKVLFFSLSEKSNIGICKILENNLYEPEKSEDDGNIIISFPNSTKVKFSSECPQCMEPICFQVFGKTEAKTAESDYDEIGWCLLGQGEFLNNGICKLRHTPLELEHKTGPGLEVRLKGGNNRSLPKPSIELETYSSKQKNWREKLNFPQSSFSVISHPRIALHCGYVPRDLFYLKYQRKASDEFLNGLLQVGFCGSKELSWEKVKKSRNLYVRVMQMIIFSITHYIQCDIRYQPDRISLQRGESKQCEYFSKGLLRVLKVGDCEDLAWFASSLLETIQDRKIDGKYPLLDLATRCLDAYIVCNCLVQGTAPDFRKSSSNLHILPLDPFKSAAREMEKEDEMDVFHMTCFLYPKLEFRDCVRRSGREDCTVKYEYLTQQEDEMMKLPRLYAEATACVGEYPEEEVMSLREEETLCSEQCICLPIGKESPNSTLIYGAEIDIITRYFIKNDLSPKCLTFVSALEVVVDDITLWVAPEECHWGTGKYHFIPSLDFPCNLGDEKYSRDIPLPLETLPRTFDDDLVKLQAYLHEKGVTFFSKRFFTRLKEEKTNDSYVKSPFGPYYYVFPHS